MRKAERGRRYVILDSHPKVFQRFLGGPVQYCRTLVEIARAYNEASTGLTWITYARKFNDELLKAALGGTNQRLNRSVRGHDCVLTIAPPRLESIPVLRGLFGHVIGDSPAYRWLPKEELAEVLFDPTVDRSEIFIAAAADPLTRTVALVRDDCEEFVVPFALFPPSGDGIKPDFSVLRVTDFGRTLAFGAYEAAADAILYEIDPAYRKKIKLQRQQQEQSFGASLFRLRKQRRLQRTDFSPLAAKTIARIERNDIGRPHGTTLATIAKRLGVAPDEIGEY